MNSEKSYCPYCNAELPKIPVRKSKCKKCSNTIYIKYSPSNRLKRLVTEKQAGDIDNEWASYYYEQDKLSLLTTYKMNINELNFFIEETGNINIPIIDLEILIIANIFSIQKINENNYYHIERLILLLNQKGLDTFDYQKSVNAYKLLEIDKSGFEKAQIYCMPGNCKYYDTLHGKIVDISEELMNMNIPARECTKVLSENNVIEYKMCMCRYAPYFGKS